MNKAKFVTEVGEMAYINDWNSVKEKIKNYDWAKKLYDETKKDCDWYVENWYDSPDRVVGWGHHYVCGKCGKTLVFDKTNSGAQVCEACGHENYGWAVNAWNSSYRGGASSAAYKAAIMYKLTGEQKYVDYIVRILNFYVENYEKFQVWVVHPMYLGRLNGQHLSDDGDVVNLITAMFIIQEELDPAFITLLGDKLFLPEAHFLKPFCYYINNIPVWDLCAIAMVGIFYKNEELTDYAFNSEFGLVNQIKLGITKENFWWEGSIHYHFFCISPMTSVYQFAVSCGYESDYVREWGETLRKMFVEPAMMAFSNGVLPNPNDGWPFISLSKFGASYDVINACFDDPVLKWVCSNVYDNRTPNRSHEGKPVEAKGDIRRLLFGVPPQDYDKYPAPNWKTQVWPDTNFSMLRKDGLEVFFKYGLIIGAHSHFDIMNIEICHEQQNLSYDLSTNGYGSFLFQWQQGTLSHCTVVTDTENLPKKGRGELLEFDAEMARIKAVNKDVYPGVDYTRELAITDGALYDTFTCSDSSGKAHTYDFMFYCEGEQSSSYDTAPVTPLEGYLYELLLEPAAADAEADGSVTYTLPGKQVKVSITGEPGGKIYLFDSYAQTRDNRRRGLMLRRENCAATTFKVKYEFINT